MSTERRIHVYREPCLLGYQISFIERRNGKTFIAEPIKLVFKEIEEYAQVAPTLNLPEWEGKQFVEEFQKLGVRTDTDEKRDGKLEATERHLADLRQLLNLKGELK